MFCIDHDECRYDIYYDNGKNVALSESSSYFRQKVYHKINHERIQWIFSVASNRNEI